MLDVDAALALQQAVRRAVGLGRRGHMRRAARVLERPPLLPLTHERLANLVAQKRARWLLSRAGDLFLD